MATTALVFSVVLPAFLIVHSVFALILKKTYKKKPRPNNFTPKCNIFVPCKGIPSGFEENIEQFFKLSYPNYNLYFAVESEKDAAAAIIRNKTDFHKKGELIISEQTKSCGQKNLNLVRAVEKSDQTAEIYVFADSDIAPKENWLDSIISPFQNDGGLSPNITATTGFRWLFPKKGARGGFVHSFQNYVLFVLFVSAAKLFNSGLWGGSMAIRKKDYDDLEVRKRWLETSVDDLSLAEILVCKKKKIKFCFDAITDTDDTINDYKKVSNWYVRQVQYLKYHAKPLWFAAILMSVAAILMYLSVAIIVFFSASISAEFLLVPVFFLGGIYLFSLMFALFGKSNKIFHFVLLSPISLFNVCVCVIRTAFENKIDWSGYRYFMNFKDGKVKKVEII